MKTYDYIIELERPDYTLVDMISRLMLMIAIAMMGYTVIWTHNFFSWYQAVLLLLIAGIIFWVIRCYRLEKKGGIPMYRTGLGFATIGMGMLLAFHWIPFLYFLAVVAEKQVKFPKEVAFDKTGILINSLPKKTFPWVQVQNVVLKDGILTIDLKNNQLIQKAIASGSSAAEEQDFNEFCRSMLTA